MKNLAIATIATLNFTLWIYIGTLPQMSIANNVSYAVLMVGWLTISFVALSEV